MSARIYTTGAPGRVRGGCGHRHRSIRTACQCALRDHRNCASVGGYSDRTVMPYDGGELTDDEMAEIDMWMCES